MNYTLRSMPDPDVFVVKQDCSCWCAGKQCWQQMFTGLLCKHALLGVVARLTMCRTPESRQEIYDKVIQFCNGNWLKKRYSSTPPFYHPPPPSVQTVVTTSIMDDKKHEFVVRFREMIRCLPPRTVEKYLQRMESRVFRSNQPLPTQQLDPPTDEIRQFVNPPKRRRRKKLVFETPTDK